MNAAQHVYIRLPVENLYNARDLGGYAHSSGVTAWKRFVRSDDLFKVSEDGLDFLRLYGIHTIIDLRSEHELSERPNPASCRSEFRYIHAPFSIGELSDWHSRLHEMEGSVLAEYYVRMLRDCSDTIKSIFKVFAENEEGGILFHCAAGKDRTGVIAMLLLGLAGVSDADIIANYRVTYDYLSVNPDMKSIAQQLEKYKLSEELIQSNPESIQTAMDYIHEEFGGYISYLLKIGISSTELEAVKQRISG